jgi:hypothetical protein
MCLLTYFQPGAQPNVKHLAAGAASNRDGHGYAIVDGTTLFVRKSLDPGPLIAEFEQLRREHPSGPAIFHSRFATGGVRTTYNAHPFTAGADKLTVLAHNGVLWSPPSGERRCDTRMFAEGMFPVSFSELDHFRLRVTMERWLGGNKLAVLTVNPKYSQTAYLFNEDAGRWVQAPDGAIWYSNSSYLRAADWYPRWLGTLSEGRCEICMTKSRVDLETKVCAACHYCNECFEHEIGCLCPGRTGWVQRKAITAGPSS